MKHGKNGAETQLWEASPLPAHPKRDLPSDHCLLPGRRFSHLQMKHRSEVSLPPMARSSSQPLLSTASGRQSRQIANGRRQKEGLLGTTWHPVGASQSAAVLKIPGMPVKCYGKYCNAEVPYPASLQDVESSNDPWMRQARDLCKREYVGPNGHKYSLFNPEEMAACLQDTHPSTSAPSTGPRTSPIPGGEPTRAPGNICVSWILEAKSHPSLCHWLETDAGWMLNPQDMDLVAEAARRLREDDEHGGGAIAALMDANGCTKGMRYRLRTMPVCGNCFSIYTAIHAVITMIRLQRRDLWASNEQRLRRDKVDKDAEREKEDMLEWLTSRKKSNVDSIGGQPGVSRAPMNVCGVQPTSLIFDDDMRDFIRGLDVEEGSLVGAATPSRRNQHVPASECSPSQRMKLRSPGAKRTT